MKPLWALSRLGLVILSSTLLCGCVVRIPQPQAFVDSTMPEPDLGIQRCQAQADGEWLIIDIVPLNLPFRGLDFFEAGGNLYFSPRYDGVFTFAFPISERRVVSLSSNGATPPARDTSKDNRTSRFKAEVSKYHLGSDWQSHVYWVVEDRRIQYGICAFGPRRTETRSSGSRCR
jgi:hypothetical protein